nr:glycoside hydrolase family 3 C-terminal domain-containing protein [Klebsiella pneumoniae]
MTLSSSQLDLKVRPDVAIVAMGEDSYAEWLGDIPDNKTLSYSELKAGYSGDLKLLRQLNKAGIPTVVILLSGRPLYVNEEINLADAFVAALRTQAEGITDVIFRDTNGTISHDFQGLCRFHGQRRNVRPQSTQHQPISLAGSVLNLNRSRIKSMCYLILVTD